MELPIAVELAIIVALTLGNGLFAGAEIAIVAMRSTRVRELEGKSASGAALARLRRDPERFLATVQIGITVISATAAAFGGATLARDLAPVLADLGLSIETARSVALALVVLAVSYLSLVLGELVPKSLALQRSERYALFAARPLLLLSRLASPLVWFLTASSNAVLRLFGDRTSFAESQISRDELLSVIDEATDAGEVSPRAGDMASRAIDLETLHAAAVMVPRGAVATVDADATRDELGALLDSTDEERFPVRRGEDITGYVTTRDIARLLGGRVSGGLSAITRPVIFVPESGGALALFERLQATRVPIAVVVDESGSIEGVVDIDDLAEEVVGTLLVGAPRDEQLFAREEDGAVVVPAGMRIHVVNRALDLELPVSPRWSTVGGLLLSRLAAMPSAGARVQLEDGTELEAVEASARRVLRVRIHPA